MDRPVFFDTKQYGGRLFGYFLAEPRNRLCRDFVFGGNCLAVASGCGGTVHRCLRGPLGQEKSHDIRRLVHSPVYSRIGCAVLDRDGPYMAHIYPSGMPFGRFGISHAGHAGIRAVIGAAVAACPYSGR